MWMECWMTRPDLGSGMDGWQALDPTPQERSGGVCVCVCDLLCSLSNLFLDKHGRDLAYPPPRCPVPGVFCCGPAPVAAVKDRRIDLLYDIPFVYAAVNADIHTVIVSKGQVIRYSTDTEKVGSLICTKAVGLPRPQNVTGDYKHIKSTSRQSEIRSPGGLILALRHECSLFLIFATQVRLQHFRRDIPRYQRPQH